MKNSFYKENGKILKQLGFIDYDLRGNLSRGQKSAITKFTAEYKEVIKHPERFSVKNVSKDTAKKLKENNYRVNKQKAIIPKKNFKSVKIKNGKIIFEGDRIRETVILTKRKDFLSDLKALTSKDLPRNAFVTAKIGENNSFQKARFPKYSDLLHYIQKDFQPKDPKESKKRLIGFMSIVEITGEAFAKKKTRAKKKRRN